MLAAGDYFVTVEKEGCTEEYTTTFVIPDEGCDCSFYIPNVISPSLIQESQFVPQTSCALEFYELTVYDRWGSKSFNSYDPNEAMQASELNKGVYTYILSYKFANKEESWSYGSFTLL